MVSSVAGTLGKRMRATVEVDFSLSALSLSFVFLHGASTPFFNHKEKQPPYQTRAMRCEGKERGNKVRSLSRV